MRSSCLGRADGHRACLRSATETHRSVALRSVGCTTRSTLAKLPSGEQTNGPNHAKWLMTEAWLVGRQLRSMAYHLLG